MLLLQRSCILRNASIVRCSNDDEPVDPCDEKRTNSCASTKNKNAISLVHVPCVGKLRISVAAEAYTVVCDTCLFGYQKLWQGQPLSEQDSQTGIKDCLYEKLPPLVDQFHISQAGLYSKVPRYDLCKRLW